MLTTLLRLLSEQVAHSWYSELFGLWIAMSFLGYVRNSRGREGIKRTTHSLLVGGLLSVPTSAVWAVFYFDVVGGAGTFPPGVFSGAILVLYFLAIPGLLVLVVWPLLRWSLFALAAAPNLLRPRWKNSSHHVRADAAKSANQRILARLAKDDHESTVRQAAVERLDDQEILASVAKDDRDSNVRHAASKRLTDPKVLVAMAIGAPDPFNRLGAARRIWKDVADTQSLAQMACALVECFQDPLHGEFAVGTALDVAERSGDKQAFEVVAQAILDQWGYSWSGAEWSLKNKDIRDLLLSSAERVASSLPSHQIEKQRAARAQAETREREKDERKAIEKARELEMNAQWVVREHGLAFLRHLQAMRVLGDGTVDLWFRSHGIESAQQRLLIAYFEAKGFIWDSRNIDNVSQASAWVISEEGSEYVRDNNGGS